MTDTLEQKSNIVEPIDPLIFNSDRSRLNPQGRAFFFTVSWLGKPLTEEDKRIWTPIVWSMYKDIQKEVFNPDDQLHPNSIVSELQKPGKTPYAVSGIGVLSGTFKPRVLAFSITDKVTLPSGMRYGYDYFPPTTRKGMEDAFLETSERPLLTDYLSDRIQAAMSEIRGNQPLELYGDDTAKPFYQRYGQQNGFVPFVSGIAVPSLAATTKRMRDTKAGRADLLIRPNALHPRDISVEDAVEIVRNYLVSGFGAPQAGTVDRLVQRAEQRVRESSHNGKFVYEGAR